jgi:hypothetical protein
MLKLAFLLLALGAISFVAAEDLKTLDGKEFTGITNVTVQPDCLKFMTPTGPQAIDFLKLSEETRAHYHYDPLLGGIARGMKNKTAALKKTDAFSLATLNDAVAKATAEKKCLGFMMMWDKFYGTPVAPMTAGSTPGALHFYNSFKDSLVLVFVAHESELDKVPESVKKGFAGPDEGGWAPNLCVVSSDLKDYIVEIPLGGPDADGKARQKIFSEKIAAVQAYLSEHGTAVTK